MNDTHNQPHTGASLTAEERAAMKREFVSFMQANPPVRPKARTGIRSPYFPHLMRIPAFAVAFLALMGGTAYAAEQSLPNDFLYPIKTAVIEPLFFEAPARTSLAKAGASKKLVERRLEEAEALIDQNELDAKSASSIIAAVDEHTNDVQAFVTAATQSGELSDALAVGTDLENVLEAHTEVLESIAGDSSATDAVTDLIENMADQADEVEATGETLEQQTSQSSGTEINEYLAMAGTDARTTITSLRTALAEFAGQDEELVTEATSYLQKSEAAFEAGTTYLLQGQKSAALPQLRDAHQLAEQGLILVKSHEELHKESGESQL